MKTDEQIKREFDEIAVELNKSNFTFPQMSRVWNFFLLKVEPLQREMLLEYSAMKIKDKIQRMMKEKMGGQSSDSK